MSSQVIFAYVIAPLIAVVGVLFAAWRASTSTVRAAKLAASPEEEKSALLGYHQLVLDIQTDMRRLRQDHEDLKVHVVRLEQQATKDKSLIRWLIFYIKGLRNEIIRLGGKVPPAPSGLDLYLDDETELGVNTPVAWNDDDAIG